MQEIKTVVTPIDFSDNAGKVVRAAAYVAGTFKATLHLIFVVQNFEDYSGFFVPPVNMPNLEEELFQSAQQRMDSFVEEHRQMFSEFGVPDVRARVLSGDVAEEILAYAAEKGCNLIVMGTHGYKGLERIMFGSVADKVVKNSCCPVMTINPYREECEEKAG
ncbi:universal stress protein [Thermodesulfobacteriota bacterium B35]